VKFKIQHKASDYKAYSQYLKAYCIMQVKLEPK